MTVKMSHMEIASAVLAGLPKGHLYIQIRPVPSRPVPAPAFTKTVSLEHLEGISPGTIKQILGYNSRLRCTN